MSDAAIRDVVRNYIIDTFLLGDDSQLTDQTLLLESGVYDSLGVADFTAFLENRYNITINDDEITADNLNSVESILKFLSGKLADRQAA